MEVLTWPVTYFI